jgi:hypothetical protein
MADLGVQQNWLVSPTHDIEIKWLDVQIQERKSRIARHKQDIEDLVKGRITELEAKIMMLDLELKELEAKKKSTNPIKINMGV